MNKGLNVLAYNFLIFGDFYIEYLKMDMDDRIGMNLEIGNLEDI